MGKKLLFYFLVAFGAMLVLVLSWQPHSQMTTDWFIPHWVAVWADERRNNTLRTAVPFVALGWLIGSWLAYHGRPWPLWLFAWAALVALVTTAEVGQLFLHSRVFQLGDIAWGAVGGLLGLGTIAAMWGLRLAVRQ